MGSMNSYKARHFNLSNLKGISDETLEMHFKLYEGYVTNTNTLNEKIAGIIGTGSIGDVPSYSELTRRLGFEYNGIVTPKLGKSRSTTLQLSGAQSLIQKRWGKLLDRR